MFKLPNHNADTIGTTLEGLVNWAIGIEKLIAPLLPAGVGAIADDVAALVEDAESEFGAKAAPPPAPATVTKATLTPPKLTPEGAAANPLKGVLAFAPN